MPARSAKHFPIPSASSLPAVVGTVHTPGGLRIAGQLGRGGPDWLELRVDAFHPREQKLLEQARALRRPLLVTVRDSSEGGAAVLPLPARAECYHRFLPVAAAIDIELASLPPLRAVVEEARRRGILVILSSHHFNATPPLARLRQLARRAQAKGADLFKCATLVRAPEDLHTLHRFVANPGVSLPIAAMGMGPLGAASRLLLAAAGSALTYGYLDRPNAPGQIEARALGEMVRAVTPPAPAP